MPRAFNPRLLLVALVWGFGMMPAALLAQVETGTIAGVVDVVRAEADSWIPISVERLQRIRSRQRLLRQCTSDGRAERRRRPATWLRASHAAASLSVRLGSAAGQRDERGHRPRDRSRSRK